jgi:thioredoxin
MPIDFDVVLASNDMSLDRVLGAGLPVAMVFYQKELSSDLRQRMDELAREYSGKVLMIMLAQSDAAKAVSRFGIRQFPTLVTVRDGDMVTQQENVRAGDLKTHIAHLAGEGPAPGVRTSDTSRSRANQATTAGTPIPVNEANFDREVLSADIPVVVDFWAPWCSPCRMVEPVLNSLAREQAGTLKIAKINVDENPGLASRYGAMSIPTMLVVVNGREVDRWVGALPESAIRNRLARWTQGERVSR